MHTLSSLIKRGYSCTHYDTDDSFTVVKDDTWVTFNSMNNIYVRRSGDTNTLKVNNVSREDWIDEFEKSDRWLIINFNEGRHTIRTKLELSNGVLGYGDVYIPYLKEHIFKDKNGYYSFYRKLWLESELIDYLWKHVFSIDNE